VYISPRVLGAPGFRGLRELAGPELRHPVELSAREREVLGLVAAGATDAGISERLSVSLRTVRSILDRVRDKTGLRRRSELTRYAVTEGLAAGHASAADSP
jgi:DNA-binding NarL/FixJ family response regulator